MLCCTAALPGSTAAVAVLARCVLAAPDKTACADAAARCAQPPDVEESAYIGQGCTLKALADAPPQSAGVLNGFEKHAVLLHTLDAKGVVHAANLRNSTSVNTGHGNLRSFATKLLPKTDGCAKAPALHNHALELGVCPSSALTPTMRMS